MTITELYSLFLKHPAVTTDSRNCLPDSLFFALKGEKFDGNRYAVQALLSGCRYAVMDDAALVTDKRMILVDNVLSTLQQLARLHRKTFKILVIGITGTNGKTTTKELTATVLAQKYKVLSTQGNLNNHIGVPLTLLRLTNEHEIAVIEMGANHPGEIGELASIACPDYGLITNVGYAHLEGFGSLEGVIKTKVALYDQLRAIQGTVFIHLEDDHLTAISGGLHQITYGAMDITNSHLLSNAVTEKEIPVIGGKATGRHPYLSFIWQFNPTALSASRITGEITGQHDPESAYSVNTKLVGDYNLWNVLAAIAIGVYFMVPPEKINEAITGYEPANNRSQLKKTNYNELIIDAYNANPSSMQAAIENFAAMPCTPKAVILGDMLELGEKSAELHATVIRQVKAGNFEKALFCGEQFSEVVQPYSCFFEKTLLCGEQFCETVQPYPCFPTVEQLNGYLEANPLQGYHILIKGSHGICLEKTIEFL